MVSSFQTGPFYIQSPAVSTFNQQLWLSAKTTTDFDESRCLEFVCNVHIYVLDNMSFDAWSFSEIHVYLGGSVTYPLTVGIKIRGLLENNQKKPIYKDSMHNRTRNLKCKKVSRPMFNSTNCIIF